MVQHGPEEVVSAQAPVLRVQLGSHEWQVTHVLAILEQEVEGQEVEKLRNVLPVDQSEPVRLLKTRATHPQGSVDHVRIA